MIWFGWVSWHINHCRLFNAKSFLYIYIKYIGFGLVGFYVKSTIVGYLVPNPYIYIYIYIYIFQTIQFSKVQFLVYTKLNVKTVLFQTINFIISTQFISI